MTDADLQKSHNCICCSKKKSIGCKDNFIFYGIYILPDTFFTYLNG